MLCLCVCLCCVVLCVFSVLCVCVCVCTCTTDEMAIYTYILCLSCCRAEQSAHADFRLRVELYHLVSG